MFLVFFFSLTVYYQVIHPKYQYIIQLFKNNLNIKFRNALGADFTPDATHFHWNFPYGQIKAILVLSLDVLKCDDILIKYQTWWTILALLFWTKYKLFLPFQLELNCLSILLGSSVPWGFVCLILRNLLLIFSFLPNMHLAYAFLELLTGAI